MSRSRAEWYLRRLQRMSPVEVAWRSVDTVRHQTWRRRQVAPGSTVGCDPDPAARFASGLPQGAVGSIPEGSAVAVLAAADSLLAGRATVLGVCRDDLDAPDWFFDPVTGRRAPQADYSFGIDHRSEAVTGNVKQVWEPSRLQHVTLLAAAYAISRDARYAEAADRQLRSWWAANPFLSGVHWTSGIEVGLRLISWVWTRRLLDGWTGARDLFEGNPVARAQVRWHQTYLAAFRSRGSSANNHVIAEAAGQLVGALGFPWFPGSARWADGATRLLQRELAANTFPSGVNREMAFEYHGFVAELGLVAAVEADRAGRPLDDATWRILARMLDVVAATVDEAGEPPRYGDADDGRGFLLTAPGTSRWSSLLAIGRATVGAASWWPPSPPDAASALIGALANPHRVPGRAPRRPARFADAGLTILRSRPDGRPEIWCRCDAGPHGFLSIAAHAHADALSVEVRHGGVDVLADPGTYCYHGEARWRSYFRSTRAHNTIEVGGTDQSTSGGHFLWTRHAQTTSVGVGPDADGGITTWSAAHDGYAVLDPPVGHRRTVRLDPGARRVEIDDELVTDGVHPVRIAFHLGPAVSVALDGHEARLTWPTRTGRVASATLRLPEGVRWSSARGETDPVLGWYSPGFGRKEPATSLVGDATTASATRLSTVLQFDD